MSKPKNTYIYDEEQNKIIPVVESELMDEATGRHPLWDVADEWEEEQANAAIEISQKEAADGSES